VYVSGHLRPENAWDVSRHESYRKTPLVSVLIYAFPLDIDRPASLRCSKNATIARHDAARFIRKLTWIMSLLEFESASVSAGISAARLLPTPHTNHTNNALVFFIIIESQVSCMNEYTCV
jgi:hypothetical protein